MSAKELRELLADVPDHYEVGIEILVADDRDVIPIEGKSDTRWDCTFALLCDNRGEKYVKLA